MKWLFNISVNFEKILITIQLIKFETIIRPLSYEIIKVIWCRTLNSHMRSRMGSFGSLDFKQSCEYSRLRANSQNFKSGICDITVWMLKHTRWGPNLLRVDKLIYSECNRCVTDVRVCDGSIHFLLYILFLFHVFCIGAKLNI